MPFVPVADVVMVEMRMRLDSQKIENTLYFRRVGGWDLADATPLGNDMLIWWTTHYAPFVSISLTLNEIYITSLASATGFVYSQPAPTPNPTGDEIANVMPNNVALTVSFRTSVRGRSFRGRNYISGLPEDAVTANTVDNTTIAAVTAGYEELMAVASGNSAKWCVVSRYSGVDGDGDPIPRVAGIATDIASVLVVDATVDSMRRRLPGRGS
jgi:hypothetical protein